MTVVLSTPLAPPSLTPASIEEDKAEHRHPGVPCPLQVLRRLSVNLLVACVVPATLFTGLMFGLGITVALVGTLFWAYAALGWQVLHGRRVSGLLIVTSSVLTLRTLVALASGNTFLYFLQPVATDACIAAAFFASLATTRPVVARLAGDFYPLTDELAKRERIVRLFRRLTLLWATASSVKATVTFWLLQTQSVETFVVVKNAFVLTMNLSTIGVTLIAAIVVARKEGLLGHASPGWLANGPVQA